MGSAEHSLAPTTDFIKSWGGLWRFLPPEHPRRASRTLAEVPELWQFPPAGTTHSPDPCARAGKHLGGEEWECAKLETQSRTSKGKREGRGGGPSCAWECSWGEERAELGEGGTGGDTRGEFSSLEAFCGAGCLGRPLEELWEAAAEQGELSCHHGEQGLPWGPGAMVTLLHVG